MITPDLTLHGGLISEPFSRPGRVLLDVTQLPAKMGRLLAVLAALVRRICFETLLA